MSLLPRLAVTATCCALGLARPAPAQEQLALQVEPGEAGVAREVRFTVSRSVEARLVGHGSGARRRLTSYGWLLDAVSRKVVWSMTSAKAEDDGGASDYDQAVRLEPGSYSAHYFGSKRSEGGPMGHLKGLLRGKIVDTGRARLELWLPSSAMEALTVETESAAPAHEIRLAPLGDDALVRRRFRLTRPVEARIVATGERSPFDGELADQSWLLELESRRVVWSLAQDDAMRAAGGSGKNQMTDRTLPLPAGSYELVALTDDSHSAARWNAPPPWNPSDWGVTIRLEPDALDERGVPEERTIVRLTGVGDDDSVSATFRLERETLVRVRGIGEWSQTQGELVDRGWIEPAAGATPVWSVTFDQTVPAGGASKNRAFDQSVKLAAGTWRARFVSDDSHSKAGWNAAEPPESRDWGLTISTFDGSAPFELLDLAPAKSRPAR